MEEAAENLKHLGGELSTSIRRKEEEEEEEEEESRRRRKRKIHS